MKKLTHFILAVSSSLLFLFFSSSPILADNVPLGVKPIKVTALSQELDILGKVQFVLTFWNVGQLSDNPTYHEAVMSGKCFDQPGADGWKCVGDQEENSGKGIFTGGPNGTFTFSKITIPLKNGKTASYSEGGQEIIFTVQNTDAFNGWNDQTFDEKTAQELGPSDNPEGMIDSSEVSITNIIGDVNVSDPSLRRGLFDQSINAVKVLTGWNKDPEPWRIRVDAQNGMNLKDGFQMKTGEGKAVIQFKDGTKFIMKENSTITFNHMGFNLDMGATIFNFQKIGKKIYITDKRGKFSIVGTKFEISTGKDDTQLKVYEGTVETETLGGTGKTLVNAGEQTRITDKGLEDKTVLSGEKNIDTQAMEKEIIAGEKTQAGKFIVIRFGAILIGILFVLGIIFNKKKIGVVLIVLLVGAGSYLFMNQTKQKPVVVKEESAPTAILTTIPVSPTVAKITPIITSEKWVGTWTNSLGEKGNDTLEFTTDEAGNIKGIWSKTVNITGQWLDKTTLNFSGQTATRGYQVTGKVENNTLILNYTATRLDTSGTYTGEEKLTQVTP